MSMHGSDPVYDMTIREKIAAMALQGLLARAMSYASDEQLARMAVAAADALIAELNK